ncbi:MAG: hypothetical protein J6Q05_02485 [Elusimicrobiaceae bacterium]|nr:hypothetical protein [Elusimicrobiaceae bacterium]
MQAIRSFFAMLLLSICLPVLAGGSIRFAGSWSKALPPQEARLQQAISLHMDRAILNASRTARLANANRTAYFQSARSIPFQRMATVSAPLKYLPNSVDPAFVLRNDKMALQWFETIEKDLHFLQTQKEAISNTLETKLTDPNEINYADLIPPHVRKIFVGEEHQQPIIYHAFEQLIRQYQQKHPDKKIIILTEFVSDRLLPWQKPGQPVSRLEMPLRQNNASFSFFSKLIKAGVTVIGLENVGYIKDHEVLITKSESQYQSVYGMQERNAHWRHIINYVADKNPGAVLFIYAGTLHTHYRAPFTLATPSSQNFVLQLEVESLGPDMPFGYIMRNEPFTHTYGHKLTVLSWDKKDPVFRTRSGFDTCIIFPKEQK